MDWIDPLQDARWARFVARHPKASVFHTPAWLDALRRTYGYQPAALTTRSVGAELVDGFPFCEVKSWINGSHLVSLPFSDHCHPLLEHAEDFSAFTASLREQCGPAGWKYVEIRLLGDGNSDVCGQGLLARSEAPFDDSIPLKSNDGVSCFAKCEEYSFHKINLRPDLEAIFGNFHGSCIQRKIQRAERESLEYEAGRSESDLRKFYRLLLLTRRRHGLPPHPMTWFQHLMSCFRDDLTIRIAQKDGQPIAGILTLRHKNTLVYKYGGSDATFHSLGAMPMLFWKVIQEGKEQGVEEFDLGRSDIDNPGLTVFKEHLGATRSKLTYLRFGRRRFRITTADSHLRIARAAFRRMPERLAQAAGSLLYRHIG
jgi:Acetyltransferase (GNAT) domain